MRWYLWPTYQPADGDNYIMHLCHQTTPLLRNSGYWDMMVFNVTKRHIEISFDMSSIVIIHKHCIVGQCAWKFQYLPNLKLMFRTHDRRTRKYITSTPPGVIATLEQRRPNPNNWIWYDINILKMWCFVNCQKTRTGKTFPAFLAHAQPAILDI